MKGYRVRFAVFASACLVATNLLADELPMWMRGSNCTVDMRDRATQSSLGQSMQQTAQLMQMSQMASLRLEGLVDVPVPTFCYLNGRGEVEFRFGREWAGDANIPYAQFWSVTYNSRFEVFFAQHMDMTGTAEQMDEYCFSYDELATTRSSLASQPSAVLAQSRCHQFFAVLDQAREN